MHHVNMLPQKYRTKHSCHDSEIGGAGGRRIMAGASVHQAWPRLPRLGRHALLLDLGTNFGHIERLDLIDELLQSLPR